MTAAMKTRCMLIGNNCLTWHRADENSLQHLNPGSLFCTVGLLCTLILGKQVCVTQVLAYASLCNVTLVKVNSVLGLVLIHQYYWAAVPAVVDSEGLFLRCPRN